ncbi:MAG: ATP-binding protein [Cytophagaceae bacterium]
MEEEIEKYRSENQRLQDEVKKLKAEAASNTYKVLFEASPDIIIRLNAEYKIMVIHIPGIEKPRLEALVGRDIFEVTPLYAHELMANALDAVCNKKETVVYYSEGETLGAYRYYENYLSPIKDDDNNITSVYFISREITAQKLAEKVLLESERKLNTVYENSIQYLAILDVDRKFVWFNRNIKEQSGSVWGREIVPGLLVDEVIAPDLRPSFIENFNKVLAGESVTYVRKYDFGNSPIYFEASLTPIYENQKVVGVTMSSTNVTKHIEYEDYLKRINMELVQQNELLNQYSYIISHNLRGPIATLMGLVKIFDFPEQDAKQTKEVVHHIYKSIENLDTIIKDLNLVINNSDQQDNLKAKVNLRNECEGILSLLSSQIGMSRAEFVFDFEQYPTLFTIKSYLHSILYNLIFNAVKYRRLDVKPVIRVSSYTTDDNLICIECSDNGLGINLEKYGNQLFGFYKRFHTHIEGKGLGLLLVKKQVELLGGRIEVESEVNKGTTFRVLLPMD